MTDPRRKIGMAWRWRLFRWWEAAIAMATMGRGFPAFPFGEKKHGNDDT